MKKIEKDGKVAVLISPGFGAGWSTWADYSIRESMCMNADIVQPVLDGDIKRAIKVTENLHPGTYMGGGEDLTVVWVPKGCRFEINEYDGSESVSIIDHNEYMIA